MMDVHTRSGFEGPIRLAQTARQRTTLALMATTALAISTAVAVTAVSIGMARADMLVTPGIDDRHFALGLLLGVVLAGMGGFAAVAALHRIRNPRR